MDQALRHTWNRPPALALRLCVVAALALGCLPAVATQEILRIPIADADKGTPGIGGGLRLVGNPYYGGSGKADLIPLYLYQGRFLFAYGDSAGVHVYRNKKLYFDVFARYRFTELNPGTEAFDDPVFDGLEHREQTIEGGVALGLQGEWGQIRLEWMSDLLDNYSGQNIGATYRHPMDRGRWNVSPYVSATYEDSSLTSYYFGVSPPEATPGRPVYDPSSTVNFSFGVNTYYRWTDMVHVFVNLGRTQFGDEITDSPLVKDSGITQAYAGAAFFFGNVKQAKTTDETRLREWSWRLNYGYQADGNIVGEIDHGDFSKSTYVDTNLAGVTFAKLLTDGPRIDFEGKLAMYRHLEDGYQDDFWSWAAYIMAMGHAYGPWSGEVAFRYGFGFGFSYAQSIPAAEQAKAAEKDRDTAQFLNYLEITLDFPLARVTKARALRHCYTGITVVHRSGIFSTSDMLSNVFGGADWITLHVECQR